ncbi:DUF2806 domain-containing protein [Mesorhizobium sp. ASY16-5R]|uniref:DUF2806 domain-containing protein n=1 Tax=Mesorhizobium sp. ASY16-5R TaxID=3445772 RepID=UPI003F9EBCA5
MPIDAESAEIQAISDARVKLIGALADLGIDRLKSDPEMAARAVENFLPGLIRQQQNKDAILDFALEDLRVNPATPEQPSVNEKVDEVFLDRFERYAQEASTDELRERWGRVLASEIRKPNTFSGKVLRVIDELDAKTAKIFERVCQSRMDTTVIKALSGEISFNDLKQLVSSDLIVDPGIVGHIRFPVEMKDNGGNELWFWPVGGSAVAVKKGQEPIPSGSKDLIVEKEAKPAIAIYLLTDAGYAISSILDSNEANNANMLFGKLCEAFSKSEVRLYPSQPDGTWGAPERRIP